MQKKLLIFSIRIVTKNAKPKICYLKMVDDSVVEAIKIKTAKLKSISIWY